MSVFDHWTEADEDAWQAKYQAQKAAEERAFQDRDCLPPRHSKVNGPPLDWKRWCCTLDGVPVGSCTEFDVDEGWVQVYVSQPTETAAWRRLPDTPQRRLHGRVEAIDMHRYFELCRAGPVIQITPDHLRGDPVPGTELRVRHA